MPFFSIITPLYNKGSFFDETRESVAAQTFTDWEWIIIDDGSTDEGAMLASEAARIDKRITFATQKNAGPCSARTRGIGEARGEWVLFLDADDVFEKDYLETLFRCCRNSDYGIHAGGWAEYDAALSKCVAHHRPAGYGSKNPSRALLDAAIAFAPWHPAAAVVQRKLLDGEYLWDEKMNRLMTEDTVFWWRLVATNKVKLENFYGVKYRRGTEGCRDAPENIEKWSESSFYALQSNADFWIGLGHRLTTAQVSNLVNVLINFSFLCAGKSGSDVIDTKAYRMVDQILKLGPRHSIKLFAIRCLGSKKFVFMRKITQSIKIKNKH
jgi:glycosyltransferase involved in cell wall biosynthesis